MILQRVCEESSISRQIRQSDMADFRTSTFMVQKIIKDCLRMLEDNSAIEKGCMRPELGSCWVQHLQKQEGKAVDNSGILNNDKVEPVVKGLGKQFKMLKKIEKKIPNTNGNAGSNGLDMENGTREIDGSEPNYELLQYVPEEAMLHLKEIGVNLHTKVIVFSLTLRNCT